MNSDAASEAWREYVLSIQNLGRPLRILWENAGDRWMGIFPLDCQSLADW